MRKLAKYVPILSSVLSAIFMFSVGFSSWLMILTPTTASAQSQFTAYSVNQFVICEAGPTVFEYASHYFVEDENRPLDDEGRPTYEPGTENVGKITFVYNFTEEAKSLAKTATGLKLTFSLWVKDAKSNTDEEPAIFTSGKVTYKNSSGASVTVNKVQATLSTGGEAEYPVSDTNNFTFDYVFKGYSDQNPLPSEVTVTYTFTTTVGQGFRSDFGKYLLNNFGADEDGTGGKTTKFFTSAEAEVAK